MTVDEGRTRPGLPQIDRIGAARSLALLLGFDFVDLDRVEADPGFAPNLSQAFARDAHVLPVRMQSGRSAFAVGVPTDARSIASLRRELGDEVDFVAADVDQVDRLLEVLYAHPGQLDGVIADVTSPNPNDLLVADEPERPSLLSILVEWDLLDEDQVERAKREQLETGRGLGDIVASHHWVNDGELISALAEEAGLDLVDLDVLDVEADVLNMIPEALARSHHVACIGLDGARPVVAISDPSDVVAIDDVRALLGREVELVLCVRSQIDELLERTFRRNGDADMAARSAALSSAASATVAPTYAQGPSDLADADDAPIVQFVNAVLRQALTERASDVHVEPTASDLRVRFRIDGVLHQATTAPKAIERGVTTRLKVMANLDIAEHRVPQDGRITISIGGREIDMRVATLPTVHGEKIVLRVLDRSTAPLELDRLGFLPDVAARYAKSYAMASGTILITGPTGSGKSTTLYATLNQLNSAERNLITVEDPAEYQLAGINQVQVNPKAGLHFANALRAILRSDPDVVLIGEIRDRETATIAVEAALTGHLVLSSLHTSDAASVPLRLIEMGVEPFLVSSSLDCVLAQRLARVLCPSCAATYVPSLDELAAAGFSDEIAATVANRVFRRPVGCRSSANTGYRGRVAIQEVMTMSEDLERAVLARAHTDEIRAIAVREGMRSLLFDGLRKAATGTTSLEEIVRVIA